MKLSVIIPVYNGEKYLRTLLNYFDEVVDINSLQIYELDKKRNLTFYLTYNLQLY